MCREHAHSLQKDLEQSQEKYDKLRGDMNKAWMTRENEAKQELENVRFELREARGAFERERRLLRQM